MMINKRLIGVCEESTKFMKLTIFFNWIALLCNIIIIWLIGMFINQIIDWDYSKNGEVTFWNRLNNIYLTEHLSLVMGCIIVGLALTLRFGCQYLSARSSYGASANARTNLRHLIYEKLLSLGMEYQNQEKTATVVQMSVEGIEQLEIYFGKYLPQFFYSLLAPLTLFVFISTLSWQVALVFMLCVPLIPASIIAIMRIAKKILKEYWNNYANLGDTFLENLQGLTTLKVYQQDEVRHQEMNEEAENFRKITMKVLSMQLNSINIMDFIAFGGAALGTIVALSQFRNGNLQVGELVIIILLSSEFFIPLRLLGSYFHVAMNGMAASDRIFELLDSDAYEINQPEKLENSELIKVQVEKVGFSYDGERPILEAISFNLEPGGLTAIVGESGSGKSTMASLLIGQSQVTTGNIFLNGIAINKINRNELYQFVTLVSAHSHIFKGSVRENLLMAKPDATEDELWKALTVARLSNFVMKLPEKLETLISENGSSLSGGQKQRLALARTILADRKFIIFDEATSNIDVESEELIWETIYEISRTKTILVISHRLASVKHAKMIHVFKNGKRVESGTHSELIKQAGVYAEMTQTQQTLEEIREVKR